MNDGTLRYISADPRMPTVRDVDGRLEVDWPEPRPATFEISAEAFELLIERANQPADGELLEAHTSPPQLVIAVCMVIQTIALIVIAAALL